MHLGVVGLMNIQFAIKKEEGRDVLYVIEVNPRASRTVPFVAKATGMPVARIAAKVMAGMTLAEQGVTAEPIPSHVSVKESVFPFRKFAGVDIVLGPEMRSTGEVMGNSEQYSLAFAKSQIAAGIVLPEPGGKIFLSVAERHKLQIVGLAKRLNALAYSLIATPGTAKEIEAAHPEIEVQRVKKLAQGHPNLLDLLVDQEVALILNTPSGKGARTDEGKIRAAAVQAGVPCITTIQAAEAVVKALEALRDTDLTVLALQDRFTMV
jgi:carbamoyl-phosphate synthase large subunit